ncbi:MAG TPA: hypothetical protein VFQ43_17730, partial [Nitrososphaera sp.]|nr:hypothetical protein [Nitrososphaera sp.]
MSDDELEADDQSNTQLSLEISVVSTATSFTSADTAATDDTDVTEPFEDGAVPEPTQISQPACDIETPVQLEIELADEAGNATVETRSVSADQVAQAQRIIASAAKAGEADRSNAIDQAIRLLYPYAPREG